MKIVKYKCDICHTVFDSEEDYHNCEMHHHTKLYIKSMVFTAQDFMGIPVDNAFPYKIVVSDVDQNVTREYYLKK